MKNTKTLLFLILAALTVSACTTTSSQTKSVANSVKNTPQTITLKKSKRLSDLYSPYSTDIAKDISVPEVDINAIPDNKNIKIKMKPGLGREFILCDASSNCEKIIPKSSTNKTVSNNYGKESISNVSDIIASVELSNSTNSLFGTKLSKVTAGKRILIMDPDIELSALTAGGLQEPNALWTSAAKGYVTEITAQYLQKLGHTVTLYKDGANNVDTKTGQDLINLHEAVGQSVFLYQYEGLFQLPTKKNGNFNWKLGKTAKQLKDGYGADLGLFVYLRDSYSSGSRIAAQFLMAALFGAHIPGGQQVGFVSLVDMNTGDIMWFNRLYSTTGDLRTFGAAFNATDALLEDLPL